jgi:hypothetical protein
LERKSKMTNKWNVYLRGKLIDSVFYNNSVTAEEVKKGLVDHDGYPSNITVRKGRMPKK